MKIYLFSMLKHDMDFGQIQVIEFLWNLLRKWWDFHRILCNFRPTCRQKDLRKSVLHFSQGCLKNQKTSSTLFVVFSSKTFHFLSMLRLNPILAPPNRHVYLILLPVFYFMGLENLLHLHFLLFHFTLHNMFL